MRLYGSEIINMKAESKRGSWTTGFHATDRVPSLYCVFPGQAEEEWERVKVALEQHYSELSNVREKLDFMPFHLLLVLFLFFNDNAKK
jgi:hypothetical protein